MPTPQTTLPRHAMCVVPGMPQDFDLWRWAVSPRFDFDATTPDARTAYDGVELICRGLAIAPSTYHAHAANPAKLSA